MLLTEFLFGATLRRGTGIIGVVTALIGPILWLLVDHFDPEMLVMGICSAVGFVVVGITCLIATGTQKPIMGWLSTFGLLACLAYLIILGLDFTNTIDLVKATSTEPSVAAFAQIRVPGASLRSSVVPYEPRSIVRESTLSADQMDELSDRVASKVLSSLRTPVVETAFLEVDEDFSEEDAPAQAAKPIGKRRSVQQSLDQAPPSFTQLSTHMDFVSEVQNLLGGLLNPPAPTEEEKEREKAAELRADAYLAGIQDQLSTDEIADLQKKGKTTPTTAPSQKDSEDEIPTYTPLIRRTEEAVASDSAPRAPLTAAQLEEEFEECSEGAVDCEEVEVIVNSEEDEAAASIPTDAARSADQEMIVAPLMSSSLSPLSFKQRASLHNHRFAQVPSQDMKFEKLDDVARAKKENDRDIIATTTTTVAPLTASSVADDSTETAAVVTPMTMTERVYPQDLPPEIKYVSEETEYEIVAHSRMLKRSNKFTAGLGMFATAAMYIYCSLVVFSWAAHGMRNPQHIKNHLQEFQVEDDLTGLDDDEEDYDIEE